MNEKALNTMDQRHPVHEEIKKCVGVYKFSATVEQDNDSLEKFRHIPGIISFICTIRLGEVVIGEGRGTAVLSRINKFLERTVRYAFNASLLDAMAKSLKMLDALQLDLSNQHNELAPTEIVYEKKKKDTEAESIITDKQKTYLLGLIKTKISDKEERYIWQDKIPRFTKDEASQAIKSFAR